MLPPEDVDRDEDRLEEEEDALDREQHAEYLAKASCERRPKKPEFEREDGPRDGADRERHRHRLRPPLRELQRVRILVAQAAVVRDQHQRRQRNAERRQDDVEPQRERHLASRRLKRRCEHQPPRCGRTGTSAGGRGTPHRQDVRGGDRPPRRPDRMKLTSLDYQLETARLERDHPVRVTLGRRRLRTFRRTP